MKKLLLTLTMTLVILLTYGILSASAEISGDLNYVVENNEAVITICDRNVSSVTIPAEINGYPVTSVRGAFNHCKNLINVEIPNSVKKIEQYAFADCGNLMSINIPNGVTSIGDNAFAWCDTLTEMNIPISVTNISGYAFYESNNLKTIYYAGSKEQWDKINIGTHNESLLNCNIIFNYNPITVTYNGEKINFDQEPIIDNGRTLVPLRAIFEKLGAEVEWDGATQTVTAKKAGTTIELTINDTNAKKNGVAVELDVPAKIVNGRTLVPVRFVSDCFGVGVEWNEENKQVVLTAD